MYISSELAYVSPKNMIDEACHAMQAEEYDVLEAIYPECISKSVEDGILRLQVPVELGTPRFVCITNVARPSSDPSQGSSEERLSVDSLPPIILYIRLPTTYPRCCPPDILSIESTDGWLPDISSLRTGLTKQWQMGESILYQWFEYLRAGDFLSDLDFLSSDERHSILIYHLRPSKLALSISTYNTCSKSEQFYRNSYLCSICLTCFKGVQCHRLSCGHIFCRNCLEDFWGMCIKEGDIDRVGCPDPDCFNEGRVATEVEISQVVSEIGVLRWRWLSEKRILERDPTTLNCPISACQMLVPKPEGTDPESGWDRFRQCSNCLFSFCSFCKFTWHGPIVPCPINHTERVITDYLATENGSPERINMEKRYGRVFFLRLVAKYETEKATTEWIASSTTKCPGCESSVEKSMGCNHMSCTRCQKHFCYRCGDALDAGSPYLHFSAHPKAPCYNKLFDDGEEENEGFMLFD